MTDYAKLKNADLEALLKERSLPHTGKKADMVARLIEADKNQHNTPAAEAQTSTAPATSESKTEPTKEDKTAAVAADAPSQTKEETSDVTATKSAPTEEVAAPSTSTSTSAPADPPTTATATTTTTADEKPDTFTSNLPATDMEIELAKRKARAAKWGIVTPATPEEDAAKQILKTREERFGANADAAAKESTKDGVAAVSALDEALPERRSRKRGRGAEEGTAVSSAVATDKGSAGSAAKKQRGDGGVKQNGAERKEKAAGDAAAAKTSNGSGKGAEKDKVKPKTDAPTWMNEADRAAAERRKAKFAAPPPAAAATTAAPTS